MKYLAYILLISMLFAGCESMEDTYSEYNTGKERYTGMCKDLLLEEGYKRFRVSWTNSVDATIQEIKVKWEDEAGQVDSVMLPPETELYETPENFTNQSYKFTVTAIDSRGKESFPIEDYGKPFTNESNLVEMLAVVQKNYYIVENKLILTLYEVGKGIYNAEVMYTSGGEEKTIEIMGEDYEKGRLVIDGVDEGTEILIQGKMKIAECFDEIPFEAYALDRERRNWSGGFIANMRTQFDMLEINDADLDTLTTLYVDYNITTLEDILYLPNLKKVVLGKKRMNGSSYFISGNDFVSKVADLDGSVFALRTMHETKGIEVEIYGNQFLLKDSLDFATIFSSNAPPNPVVPADAGQWKLRHNDPTYYENENEADNHIYALENMLDGNYFSTHWESRQLSGEIATHEIIYDMLELKTVKGFQFYQSASYFSGGSQAATVEIYISNQDEDDLVSESIEWKSAFYQPTINVGGVRGETTIAYMGEPKEARYIKLVVADVQATSASGNNRVSIGEFAPLF